MTPADFLDLIMPAAGWFLAGALTASVAIQLALAGAVAIERRLQEREAYRRR